MGYFDEQVRQKKVLEDAGFENAWESLSEVVSGKSVWHRDENREFLNKSSIEDLAAWLHVSIPKNTQQTNSFDEYLESCFRPQGVMWRAVKLKDRWYEDHVGIMTGSLKTGGLVVFIPGGKNGYFFRDPETGKRHRITKMNADLFESDATLFYRNLPLRRITGQDILQFARDSVSPREIAAYAWATIILMVLSMVFPAMTKQLVISRRGFAFIFILLLIATMAMFLITLIRQLLLPRITTKIAVPLQAAFMMRVLSAPPDKMKHFTAGDLGNRVGILYQNLQLLINMLLSMVLTAACSLVCFVQMFMYNPALGGFALALTVLLALLYARMITRQAQVSAERMAFSAEASGITYGMIDGMQKISLSGAEKRAFAVWADAYRKSMKTIYDPPLLLKIFSVLTPVILQAGNIMFYFLAASTKMDQAGYFGFSSSFAIVTGALTVIAVNTTGFANALPVFRNLKPIMELAPEVDGNKTLVKDLTGRISIQNVSFRYEKDLPWIIDHLSLEIPKGAYVAIVGATGCGKTTLVKLLLGFEKPESGEIYYDGNPLSSLNLTSLRRRIGTVLQGGEIFAGTIFHNITIAGKNLTEQDAWEAAEIAGIADDIRRMPMQMNTLLPAGGSGVSGGQKQRILIARAIASKPKILIFDEATSALDNITQKAVSDSIGEFDCTRIVIAHRLSTIQNCDRIVCLDKGNIVEQGTYEELIRKNGFFAELIKRQQI